jgi:hypothetical protein
MHKKISKQKLRIRGQGAAGYTDKEIMQDLKLKLRTFYNYKAKVGRMFANIAEKNYKVLEFEMQILKERYTRLFRSLEQSN